MSRKGSNGLPRASGTAIAILAAGGTITQAAAACHKSRQTVSRWLSHPVTAAAVTRAREEFLITALGSAASMATRAVAALARVMEDKAAPASAQVGAARALLDHLLKGREASELSSRLDAIEKALEIGVQGRRALPAPAIREIPQ